MSFLRNQWYCVALGQELKTEPLGRILLNEPVVLFLAEERQTGARQAAE